MTHLVKTVAYRWQCMLFGDDVIGDVIGEVESLTSSDDFNKIGTSGDTLRPDYAGTETCHLRPLCGS